MAIRKKLWSMEQDDLNYFDKSKAYTIRIIE